MMDRKIFFMLAATMVFIGVAHLSYASVPYHEPCQEVHGTKLGIQDGLGLGSKKIGVFVEWPLVGKFGLQSGLLYFGNSYFLKNIVIDYAEHVYIKTHAIQVPIQLRVYPGRDRQWCCFFGSRLGYVVAGSTLFSDQQEKNTLKQLREIEEVFEYGIKLEELVEDNININRVQFSLGTGLDYEFQFGLIVGVSYYKEMINLIKSEEAIANWSFQIELGYNFMRGG